MDIRQIGNNKCHTSNIQQYHVIWQTVGGVHIQYVKGISMSRNRKKSFSVFIQAQYWVWMNSYLCMELFQWGGGKPKNLEGIYGQGGIKFSREGIGQGVRKFFERKE